MKKIISKIMILMLALMFFACTNNTDKTMENTENVEDKTFSGIISGVAKNVDCNIDAVVKITNDKIVDVRFNADCPPLEKEQFQNLFEYAKGQMVNKNSVSLDAISGATMTINALELAVIDAMSDAKIDLSKYGFLDNEDKNYVNDGTYEGSCHSMNSMLKVAVTLKDKKITDVKVLESMETPGIGGDLYDIDGNIVTYAGQSPITLIPYEIKKNQSTNVDVVTGATVTSNAIMVATRNALTLAGAKKYDYAKIVRNEYKVNDLTTDVLVIGGGGAGLSSAISASIGGANVIIVEKNGQAGGDTIASGGIYNTYDNDLQKDVKVSDATNQLIYNAIYETPVSEEHKKLQSQVKTEFETHEKEATGKLFDSADWFTLQTWNGGDKVGNLNLVKKLCQSAYDGFLWIQELGVKFRDKIIQGAGSLWQRTHQNVMNMGNGYISAYINYISEHDNMSLMLNTTCYKLLYEDDKIVGALCKSKDGQVFKINAKAVILATGGFAANADMLNEYNTSGKWGDLTYIKTTNRYTVSNGDGIKMAKEVGASLTNMDQIQLLYLSDANEGHLKKYPSRCLNGVDETFFMNLDGKRFVNETARRDDICLAIMKQRNNEFYIVESGDGEKYVDIYKEDWRSDDGYTLDYLIDNGFVVIADTIDELATKLSIDPIVLKETFDDFNENVEKGTDEFGRTLFSTKLINPPFMATKRTVGVHHTMGGVTIDEEANVLDENNNKINGLFACGEVTGGIHGSNRLGGNAITDTVVFGKTAGEKASEYIKTIH